MNRRPDAREIPVDVPGRGLYGTGVERRPKYRVRLLAQVMAGLCAATSVLGQQRGADGQTTYARDVAPILFRACASCHRPGGPGPFSVLAYAEVSSWAQAIEQAIASGRMPPWLPERGLATFAGERRLTVQEVALIRQWVHDGAPEGDVAHLPAAPSFPDGWQLGEPDLVVTLPKYQAPAGGGDRYRNLVARIPVSGERWVKALEIRPGRAGVVHHARLMLDTTTSSRELDAADPEPGFDGMHLESAATHPGGFFVGWTPGRVAMPGIDSLAWRVTPGMDLVLQVHVPAHGTPHAITPQVGFHFAAGPPARSPVVIMLGSRDIDVPPSRSDYVVSDSYLLPVDVDVLGVYPHAHYLGKELQGFATLPNGRTRWLIRIRDWDFNWQDEYRYAEPVFLPRGSTLTMRWRYDNTTDNPRNPSHPPQRVFYGSRSTDEMADLVLQVLPRTVEDADALGRDIRWKYLVDQTDWVARRAYRMGVELANAGRHQEAVERFREALANTPTAAIHAALAEPLLALGEREAAALHLGEAVRLAEGAGNAALAAELRRRLQRLRQ
ncbi:MAG TPA: hypothetical protein VF970_04995 [Gemmatimonadales bacterium]